MPKSPLARKRMPGRACAFLLLPLLMASLALPRRSDAQAAPPAAAHGELLAADRALADSTARRGLASGLASALHADVVLLLPGAPVLLGADAARRALATYGERPVWWLPLHAELSADGTLGMSYGVLLSAPDTGRAMPPRHGKYLAVWRRDGSAWRIAAMVTTGALPPMTASIASAPLAPLPSTGAAAEFAAADRAFAADAGRRGAAAAFEAFAAPEAVTFPGTGDIARGPAGIGAQLAGVSAATAWEWGPVVAGAAASGDLGYTVGEATIRPAAGRPGAPTYSKYLSVWRRLPGGRIAYVADAGNGRPAPAR